MMEALISINHVFTIKMSFKNVESIIANQRAFVARFILNGNDAVSDRKSVLLCFKNSTRKNHHFHLNYDA